jgi:uncharacterized protein (DUF169 family)
MEKGLKQLFLDHWKKYFGKAELPITFFYNEEACGAEEAPLPSGRSCLICELAKVRKGCSLYYHEGNLACGGARRYLGYDTGMRKNFEFFLSCGIPGKMKGERYKRTPEIVRETMRHQVTLPARGRKIIFKRWDKLEETDQPEVVIFFATPDVLSGLFTLANFDQVEPNGVFTPFGAGCGSIVHYPYLEIQSKRPRAVIGMFDPSARPCVSPHMLTFSIPMIRFEKMIGYMEESFLITDTWKEIRKRIIRH